MHAVVIGGSVAGLGVAVALSGRGHRVTVLEADPTPLPPSHLDAFERWDRRGAPQTRHSHALLARLRNLIRDHAPELLEKLRACGAEELRFTDRVRALFPDAALEPGDEDIVFLACRRTTFEWVLRRHVLETGLVTFRDGVEVTRLEAERDAAGGPPRVVGAWARPRGGAETLVRGDLVVDASGRRSRLRSWLPAIGTPPVREASSPCGIFYTSRFYRLREGAEPPERESGIVGVDLGYLKLGIFPADSRVFSITLAASPADPEMRRILHRPGFEAAVSALPISAAWTAPEVAEPVSEVHGMANLRNTRRWLVEDGEPLALGFLAVGDALIHTNPIVGRGCSLAWVGALELAASVDACGDDLRALALDYDQRMARQVVPWYEMQLAQDADAIEVAEAQQRGEDPYRTTNPDGTQNPKAFARSLLRDGLLPALREDPPLLRAFLRFLNLLEPPGDLFKKPDVMQRVLASWARRDQRAQELLGPPREEMLARFAAASAA